VPPRARQAVLAAGGAAPGTARLVAAAVERVAECGLAPQGTGFSAVLNRSAFTLGGLVAAGELDRAEAGRLLRAVAEAVRPGQERRAEQIIRSGLAAGERHPLRPGRRP
ncbi:bifunctional DNA primase/polymerase, partial [Kitasatospora sp. NPDC004272]